MSDAPCRVAATTLVLAVLGFGQPASAQTRALVGAVFAAEDSIALEGVAIQVVGVTGTVMTDADGRFGFGSLPARDHTLVFSRIGVATDSVLVPIGTDSVDVYLRTRAIALVGMLVEASPEAVARARFEETAQASAVTIDASDVQLTPTFLEADVIRTIQLLPGTGAVNDYTVGYNARGGEVDQNLIQLDGVTIFNPSHLGGLFSTFDAQAGGEVEYLKGGFPSSYSGRLSSVLDVRTRSSTPGQSAMCTLTGASPSTDRTRF